MHTNSASSIGHRRLPGIEHGRDTRTVEALLRAVEQTSDRVFITDRQGAITYVNPACEAHTGFAAADVIGATPRLFKSGRHDANFYQKLWTTILAGRVFRCAVTNKTRDGRLYDEDQTITPIRDGRGHIGCFVTIGRDRSGRRRDDEALRRLHGQLELESARIAGALHDEAGQLVASARLTLADIIRDVPAPIQARLQQVRLHLDEVAAQLRRASHDLHPSMLDDFGPLEAIRLIGTAFARRTGLRLTVQADVEGPLPRHAASAWYHLVQEALANIARHASATAATIVMSREATNVRCTIRDDGTGFDVEATLARAGTDRHGLTVIRDRFEAIGGVLEIISAPGQGTELRTTIPLED